MLVRSLNITCVTRQLIKMLPEIFPHISYLSLVFGFASDEIGYRRLQRLFMQLQKTLTKVQISLEMSIYDASLLWSLSSLPYLEYLDLKVLYSTLCPGAHATDKVCQGVLECCPRLESMEFEFVGRYSYKCRSPVHGRVKRWMQRRVDSWRGLAALTPSPQEALAGSKAVAVQALRQMSSVKGNVSDDSLTCATKSNNNNSSDSDNKNRSLRRLHFKEAPNVLDIFSNILAIHGPGLEELLIQGHRHYSFSEHVWRDIIEHCRFLRILDIVERGPSPSIATIILGLPHLLALLVNFGNYLARYQDLGFSELGASLDQYRDRYGREHPLRCLEFGGWIDRPIKAVMDIMPVLLSSSSSSSLQLEGFRMCYGSRCFRTPPLYPSILASSTASSRRQPSTTLDHISTIYGTSTTSDRDLNDTLTQLDISYASFTDNNQGRQFIEQLQKFSRLRVLYVMHVHLWDLDRIHKSNTTSPHNDHSSSSSNNNSSDNRQQSASQSDELPVTHLCFPSIQDLYIGYGDQRSVFPLNYTPSNAVTLELGMLVVAMMPSLRFFSLGDKAALGVKGSLRERFCHIVFEGDQS